MRAELHFLGLIIDLVYISTAYRKQIDKYKGIPVFYNEGGKLYLEFPYGEKYIRIIERMLTVNHDLYELGIPLEDGRIVFYDANGDPLKPWKFKDAFVSYWKFTFDNERGITVKMELSPAIQDYGCKVVRSWHVSPNEEKPYRSPVHSGEEKKEKPLRVEFKLSGESKKTVKTGELGFHEIPSKGKLINKADYPKLEALHQKGLTQEIKNKPYYPHWVSLRKGQSVSFDIDFDGTQDQYSEIAIKAHQDFDIQPPNLKGQSKVTITCKNDAGLNTDGVQLLIKGDGKDTVGAINIFYPKPKTIDLEWVVVEKAGDDEDEELLNKEVIFFDLENWINKAFKPSLIDVRVTNVAAKVVDISDLDVLHPSYRDKIKGSFADYGASRVLTGSKANDIKRSKLLAAINAIHTNNQFEPKKPLRVYFTYFSCRALNADGYRGYTNGLTDRGSGFSFMFMKNERLETATEVPHELMHAMGLPHTFDKTAAKIALKQGSTNNYMDYDNTKTGTYIWQWQDLHKYPHLL